MAIKDIPLKVWQSPDLEWRIVLYGLLLAQLLALVSFVGPIIFPDAFQWESRFPLIVAATTFLGLLLWCSESVQPRPALTRFALRCVLGLCVLWGISPFLFVFRQSDLGARRQADVRKVFHELIAEGALPAPHPAEAFVIGSARAGVFRISYTNAAGTPRTYFVSDDLERFWKFENPMDRSEIKHPATYDGAE